MTTIVVTLCHLRSLLLVPTTGHADADHAVSGHNIGCSSWVHIVVQPSPYPASDGLNPTQPIDRSNPCLCPKRHINITHQILLREKNANFHIPNLYLRTPLSSLSEFCNAVWAEKNRLVTLPFGEKFDDIYNRLYTIIQNLSHGHPISISRDVTC